MPDVWTPRGVVAVILAACVGIGYATALIIAVVDPDRVSTSATALLYTMGGALVGGVITYLGGRPQKEPDERPGD